jgi:hypothetical protein
MRLAHLALPQQWSVPAYSIRGKAWYSGLQAATKAQGEEAGNLLSIDFLLDARPLARGSYDGLSFYWSAV